MTFLWLSLLKGLPLTPVMLANILKTKTVFSDDGAAHKGLWTRNGSSNDHLDYTEIFKKTKSNNVDSSCQSKWEHKRYVSKLVQSHPLAKHAGLASKLKGREGGNTGELCNSVETHSF